MIGGGVKHADIKKYFNEFISSSKIPCVSTYAAYEILEYSSESNIGVIGQFGQYSGNSAVENCDLLIALGTRFSIRATGNDTNLFASNAKVIHINNDSGELKDSRKKADLSIHSDIYSFLTRIDGKIKCDNDSWLLSLVESKEIDLDISNMLKKSQRGDDKGKHGADESGKSTFLHINFWLISGDVVVIELVDWSEKITNEKGWTDNVNVSFRTEEFNDFLGIAFK